MSTTLRDLTLLDRLVDDAAVFPPGSAPVPVAWARHRRGRGMPYARFVGPLLVGTGMVEELVAEAESSPTGPGEEPVEVTVIARPGTDPGEAIEAVRRLRDCPAVDVVGVEVAHDAAGRWREVLNATLPMAVEVSADAVEQERALDELAASDVRGVDGHGLVAKLRTQDTPARPAPRPEELAAFLTGCSRRGLPVKLTGGLHHAVAAPGRHGVLNVLLAAAGLHTLTTLATPPTSTSATTSTPAATPAPPPSPSGQRNLGNGPQKPLSRTEVAGVLARTDAEALAREVADLDDAQRRAARALLTSFGCCGVLDPLRELADLGVLTADLTSPTRPDTLEQP